MDHSERDAQHTAERYLLHLLAPDERAAFEEHFVDCAECIACIERAEAFQSGIAAIAAEEAAKLKHPKKPLRWRFGAWFLTHSKWRQAWMLAAACALLALGPWLFFYVKLRDAHKRIAAGKAAISAWEGRYLSEKENADRLKRQVDQVRAGQNMVTQLVAAKPIAQAVGAPVVMLEAGNTPQLEVASATQLLVFVVQLQEPFAKSTNAQLYGGEGKLLANAGGLKPNDRGEVAVSVMTSLFETGYYTLSVDVVKYTFHIKLAK